MVPIGALAEVDGDSLTLFATVTASDGSQSYRVEVAGPVEDPDIAGRAAYAALLEQGAGGIMAPSIGLATGAPAAAPGTDEPGTEARS